MNPKVSLGSTTVSLRIVTVNVTDPALSFTDVELGEIDQVTGAVSSFRIVKVAFAR